MARKGHGRPASLVQIAGSGTTYPDDGSSPVGSNEWNENRDTTGVHGFTKKTEAISSNNIDITDSYVEVTNAGEIRTMSQATGMGTLSTDNYPSDTSTKSFAEGDLLYLVKATDGHTITLKHQYGGAGSGKINTLSQGDLLLDTKIPRIFMCRTIGSYQEWVEYGGGTANDLEVSNLAAATLVTEGEGIASNDNDTTLPTSAAVKDYVDTTVATENTITEMDDTTITGPASNDLLQWNGSVWVDRTYAEAGVQAAVTFGIANTNKVQIDHASVADNDYAKFTASGVEGRSYAEVLSDIGAQAALTFGIADGAVAKCNDAVVDNDFLKIDGTEIEGRTAAEVLSDIGAQASLTFGISNTNVTKCGSAVVDDDFIRIDGTTMEGRSAAEVLSDIGGQAALTFGISNTNVTKCGSAVADNDFVKVDGTTFEGRTAAEVLSDIGALALAGGTMSGAINMGGADITNGGVIFLTEQADAEADVAGKGQIWVDTATPNKLFFTDDAGTDFDLTSAGGATLLHSYSNNTQTTVFTVSGQSVAYDAGTAVGSQAAGVGTRDVYIRKIDTNNEGVFALVHKNGAIVEVQVA